MKGFDFFIACYRQGVDLPVRIFADGKAPMNFYRPESLCFINLETEEDQEAAHTELMEGMDVSILADKAGDRLRELAKKLIQCKPRHLVVLAGDTFASWAPHRGWK